MNANEPLDEAYHHLRLKLRAYARNFNLAPDDVADALHDSYLRLHGEDLPTAEAAKGKMAVTLRNLVLDLVRKLRRRPAVPLDEETPVYVHESSPLTTADILERMRLLLSPLQFKIMTLLAVEGLDYAEIADSLEMTEGAVRTNVSRARKTLKEHFDYE